jgi:hypothetical protein
MRFTKLLLLFVAFLTLAASSALASSMYWVSVDTSSLNSQPGYLYFQYAPVNAADSTATVTDFSAGGGALGAQSFKVVDCSAVSGTLPGTVTFLNTNGINDYNQAFTFGNNIGFLLSFNNPTPGGQAGGSSTFSLGLYQDELGSTPLLGGTLFTSDLINDGTVQNQIFSSGVTANQVPEAGTMWLLGSGLVGLLGIARNKFKK